MKTNLITTAIIALTCCAQAAFSQTGFESLSQTYEGAPLPSPEDKTDCGTQLAEHMWGAVNEQGVRTFPNGKMFDRNMEALAFIPQLECDSMGSDYTKPNEPLVIHASLWQRTRADKNWSQVRGQWQVYRKAKSYEGILADGYGKPSSKSPQEQPSALAWPAKSALYNDKTANFLGVSCFYEADGSPDKDELTDLTVTYKIAIKEIIPENLDDVSKMLAALGLAKGAKSSDKTEATNNKLLFEEFEREPLLKPRPPAAPPCILTTAPLTIQNLPSDINFTLTVKDSKAKPSAASNIGVLPANSNLSSLDELPKAANVAPVKSGLLYASLVPSFKLDDFHQAGGGGGQGGGQGAGGNNATPSTQGQPKNTVGCTGSDTKCNGSHTITALDMEWWDLGLGLNIPGVKAPQYSSGNPPKQTSPKTTEGVYGFVNLYPFAPVGDKTSYYPSVVGGIPVTGQVFYQPFVGLAENITGWKKAKKWLPIQVNLVAGIVFLKQQEALANAEGTLQVDHVYVRKFMFGVELPVSSLSSKIKSLTGGNNNSSNNSSKQSNSQSGGN